MAKKRSTPSAGGGPCMPAKWKPITVTTDRIIIELSAWSLVGGYWQEASDNSGSGRRGVASPLTDSNGKVTGVAIEHWADVIDALANNALAREYMRQRLESKCRARLRPNRTIRAHAEKLIEKRSEESEGA